MSTKSMNPFSLEDPEWNQVYYTGVTLNIISIICASIIVITLATLAIYNHRSVNRISLRLQAGVALIDILNHLNNIYHWSIPDGPLCVYSGFFRVYGRQLYCFLNIAIGMNLQLIFLQGLHPNPKWEIYYWVISLVIPLVMNLPPLLLGMYGHNGVRCYVMGDENGYSRKTLVATNLGLVILVTFVYCVVISVLVVIKLRSKLEAMKSLNPQRHQNDGHTNITIEKSVKRLIFRILLYPLACIISMFFYFIVLILYLMDIHNKKMSVVALLSLTFTGMMNLIAFLLDPTFHSALRMFLKDVKSPSDKHGVFKLQDSPNRHELEISSCPLTNNNNLESPSMSGRNNLQYL